MSRIFYLMKPISVMHYFRVFLFPALLITAACTELNPETSALEVDDPPEMRLSLLIQTQANPETLSDMQTTVSAQLLAVSGLTTIPIELRLGEQDSITATADMYPLTLDSFKCPTTPLCPGTDLPPCEDDPRSYTGSFPSEVSDASITVDVQRFSLPPAVNPDDWWVLLSGLQEPGAADLERYFIVVSLPQPFTIDAPTYVPNAVCDAEDDTREVFEVALEAKDSDDVTITWTPNGTGEDMLLQYASRCPTGLLETPEFVTQPQNIEIDDNPVDPEDENPPTPGVYIAKVNTFLAGQPTQNAQHADGCIIRLVLTRLKEDITADPALSENSSATASYSRFIEIKSMPSEGGS
jgi:hypothetical protein